MPVPEGWTEEDERKRDEIVRALLRDPEFKGRGPLDRKQRAYAIATAQVEKMKRDNSHGNPHNEEKVYKVYRKEVVVLSTSIKASSPDEAVEKAEDPELDWEIEEEETESIEVEVEDE